MRENNVGEDNLAYKKIAHTIDAAFGVEQVYELPFVLEDVTAKKVVSYITNRTLNSNRYLSGKGDATWSSIRFGQIVTVTVPRLNITAVTYMVQEINYDFQGKFDVVLRPYSADTYNDVALATPTAWTPTSGYGSIYEVPYVTVSPTPGMAMFTTIEQALADLPPWARRIVLMKGTHTAPTSTLDLPAGKDVDIVGESRANTIVQNQAGNALFRIDSSDQSYRFSNFTISSQNNAITGSTMIYFYAAAGTHTGNVVVDGVIFNLEASDIGVQFAVVGGTSSLVVRDCQSFGGNAAISIPNGGSVNIFSNKISDATDGVKIYVTAAVLQFINVINNYILNFVSRGIALYGNSSYDIKQASVNENILITDQDSPYAIYAQYIADSIITNNIIKMTAVVSTTAGIHVEKGHRISVADNNIFSDCSGSGTTRGVYFHETDDGAIDKNIIQLDQGGATDYAMGVHLYNSVGNSVEGNKIDLVNNKATYDIGFYMPSGANNNEGANNVTKNVGTPLTDGGSGNNVTGNDEGTPF